MNMFILSVYLMTGDMLELPYLGTTDEVVIQAMTDYATMPCMAVDVIDADNRLVYFIGEEP
jgi:hypothetical protein